MAFHPVMRCEAGQIPQMFLADGGFLQKPGEVVGSRGRSAIPKGLESFSPRVARNELPWVNRPEKVFSNPNGAPSGLMGLVRR